MADPDAKWLLKEALTQMQREAGDGIVMNDTLPALTAFVREFGAADFSCVMCGLPPTPPTVHPGPDGLERGWRDYAETFESVRVRFRDFAEGPDGVVSLVDQMAITRHGGVDMSQPSAMVFIFEGGRVKRIEFHLDHAEALRSAGIES